MTEYNKERLGEAKDDFIRMVGVSNYSDYTFAIWLIDNEPGLSECVIEHYMKLVSVTKNLSDI